MINKIHGLHNKVIRATFSFEVHQAEKMVEGVWKIEMRHGPIETLRCFSALKRNNHHKSIIEIIESGKNEFQQFANKLHLP